MAEQVMIEKTASITELEQQTGPQLGAQIRLRLLVIAPQRNDQNLCAISALLDQIGVPYDTLIATETPLTAERLWQNNHAFYQGVILTTGNLLYWNADNRLWQSAFDPAAWQTLWRFEARFCIRQLVLYAVGDVPENFGLQLNQLVNTRESIQPTHLTAIGRQLFPYLAGDIKILVEDVPLYLAQPCNDRTVPLLTTTDGHAVAALTHCGNGRELLSLTMAHNVDLWHTLLLGYGLINWVTRGLFLGERHLYLALQVDDIFNTNCLWDPQSAREGSQRYRLTATDATAFLAWLDHLQRKTPNAANITMDFAFNGAGINSPMTNDELATTLLQHEDRFRWINHGFTHLHLDHATYHEAMDEIKLNHVTARAIGLSHYEPSNMVTAVVSGLENCEFLRAAGDAGIDTLVADTSRPGWESPTPNTGIANPRQPTIFCLPRRPTNLFYDVSTPAEWVSKYNAIYESYWDRELTLAEILTQEASAILRYLLRFEINPIMFHQANLRAYNGQQSLLGDLIDRVLTDYNNYYGAVPIACPTMEAIGVAMRQRDAYNAAHITATWIVGRGIKLSTDRAVTIPITGLSEGGTTEWYAGQPITFCHFPTSGCREIELCSRLSPNNKFEQFP